MGIYTDLAKEACSLHPELSGVTEEAFEEGGVSVSRIRIETGEAAEQLGRSVGCYVTIDAPLLEMRPAELFTAVSKLIARELTRLLPKGPGSVLAVGLGNMAVTPDSLGARTAQRIFVTRHIVRCLPEAFGFPVREVAVTVPGVLGTTGVETADLIKGVCGSVKPSAVIAIDSLAAASASRIGTTVQLSDAGIDPGSGVGNLRSGLNKESLGVPVIAVGVPLVVRASVLASEANAKEKDAEKLSELIVTPKDIDRIAEDTSVMLAEGVNRALFAERYEAVRAVVI